MIKWKSTVAVAAMACLSLVFAASITSSVAAGGPAPAAAPAHPAPVGPASITTNPELLYVSLTPCRIVDTRKTGAKFNNHTVHTYWVAGSTFFVPQGGTSGGCGIPFGAKAITASMTAVNPSGPGFVRAWAAGTAEPNATLLNYSTVNTGTGVNVPIRSGNAPGLTVKNYGGPTHLVIDVTGYYIPQMQAYISTAGPVINQSGRLLSSINTGVGTYSLTWDRNVQNCSAQVNADDAVRVVAAINVGSTTTVQVWNLAGALTNYWFYISVHC